MEEDAAVIGEEPEHSLLLDLPDELWVLILKKVPQKDALNLRLVSKDLKDIVNNFYEDWAIRLDDCCPYLEMMLDLRVKEVTAFSLGFRLSFRPPGMLFKYPDLIQKLTFNSKKSSTQYAHILLQSKNLKSLCLELRDFEFPEPLDPLIGYNYPELHTLKLVIKIQYEKYFDPPWNLVQRILLHSTMPKLTSFQAICQPQIYEFQSVLLTFLNQEGRNLKRLIYKCNALKYFYIGFVFVDGSPLENMKSLETLKLNPFSNDELLSGIFRGLIQNQRNLVNLNFSFNFFISSTFLRGIVSNNFQTLTSVKINRWVFEEGQTDGVFDASIFQACDSLTILKVTAHSTYDTEVINLFSLPTQIQTLDLYHFQAHSEDVLNFLLGHPALSYLDIDPPNSLNVSGLEAVLGHSALCYVYFRRGFKMQRTLSEVLRLNSIFETLGCKKFRGQFDFDKPLLIKRAVVAADWKAEDDDEW